MGLLCAKLGEGGFPLQQPRPQCLHHLQVPLSTRERAWASSVALPAASSSDLSGTPVGSPSQTITPPKTPATHTRT